MAQPPSVSADGVWHHLRLAPGLASADLQGAADRRILAAAS